MLFISVSLQLFLQAACVRLQFFSYVYSILQSPFSSFGFARGTPPAAEHYYRTAGTAVYSCKKTLLLLFSNTVLLKYTDIKILREEI